MDKVAADAEVVIDFFNGKEPARSHLADLISTNRLVLSAITIFELRAGVTGKKRLAAIEKLTSLVPSVGLDAKASAEAASQYTRLKQEGKLIGIGDLLLAGTCVAKDVPLYTRNQKHFSRITGRPLTVGPT